MTATESLLHEMRHEIEQIRSSINVNPHAIGNLNGKWAVLFKAIIAAGGVALPFLVALNVWTVTEINALKIENARLVTRFEAFANVGPRYSADMAAADQYRLKEEIVKTIEQRIENGSIRPKP